MPKDLKIAVRDCLSEIAISHEIEYDVADVLEQSNRSPRSCLRHPNHLRNVRHIPGDCLADFPTEPWTQIKGIGNRIRHEYIRIDDATPWDVITTDTHSLKTAMEAMLARHGGEKPR